MHRLSFVIISLFCLLSLVSSHPTDITNTQHNDTLSKRQAPSWAYRILPLGASIMFGKGSETSGGNGLRKYLRDTLRQSGYKVNMVGSQQCGTMADNACEATTGYTVDQVHGAAKLSTKYQPNIILINAGNNDARLHDRVETIGERMDALLDTLFTECPGTTILLSTLIYTTVGHIEEERARINAQYQSLAHRRRYAQGQKIILVDMDRAGRRDWGGIEARHLDPDGVHPNDEGFAMMAAAFRQGISEAQDAGFITAPHDSDYTDDDGGSLDNTCPKKYGVSRGPIPTQGGSGLDDGAYTHSAGARHTAGTIYSLMTDDPFVFAKLSPFSPTHHLIEVTHELNANGWRKHRYYTPQLQASKPYFPASLEDGLVFYTQDACVKRGIRWADINDDGMDDMLCVAENGDVFATVNNGITGTTGGIVGTTYRGLWKANVGYPQARVRIADVDGDGRADYCVVLDNGDVKCWRNGGQDIMPEYWQPLGTVFTGKGMGDIEGVRFFDINGDDRDDWLWMDDTGRTHTYTNSRSCDKGVEGQGLTPYWRPATSNPTHAGLGTARTRDHIYFANLFQSPAAFGLKGRGDYVQVVNNGKVASSPFPNHYSYTINVWQNTGSGGTKLKGDGTRFCNMMGHANKAMDMVWIHSTGYMRIYQNKQGGYGQAPYWGPNYIIFNVTSSRNMDRRDLHLADWDGDGLCDIIYVDPGPSGNVDVWLNRYRQNGNNFNSWEYKPNAGPREGPLCPRRGTGLTNWGTQFADITGNKHADMLCLERDGRVFGYLNSNGGNTWQYSQQLKKSEGKDRANLRFADVNGDGRADLLWVDKFNGDTTVWENRGPIPASGSDFTWTAKGKLYQGALAGSCIAHPDIDGNGRADMSAIQATTNAAETWFNDCGDIGGDDPNTHSARSVLPAPPVDELTTAFLASRWNGRVDDMHIPFPNTFDIGPMPGNPNPEALDLKELFAFAGNCGQLEKESVLSAWHQLSNLVDFIYYHISNGEINWSHIWATDFFGPPSATGPYRARILDVLSSMARFTRPRGAFALPQHKLRFTCAPARCGWIGAYAFVMNMGEEEQHADWEYATGKTPTKEIFWPGASSITLCPGFLYKSVGGLFEQHEVLRFTTDHVDWYKHRGTTLSHEILHMREVSKVVPYGTLEPKDGDIRDVKMFLTGPGDDSQSYQAYSGDGARALAKFAATEGGKVATHRNADSYMLYVLSWFVMENGVPRGYPSQPGAGRIPVRLEQDVKDGKRRRRGGGVFSRGNTTAGSWNGTGPGLDLDLDLDLDAPLVLGNFATLYRNGTAVVPPESRLMHAEAAPVGPPGLEQTEVVVHLNFENAFTRDMYPPEFVAMLDAAMPDLPVAVIGPRNGSLVHGNATFGVQGSGNGSVQPGFNDTFAASASEPAPSGKRSAAVTARKAWFDSRSWSGV